MALTAPFPYFGGKRRVADQVWSALGDVKHYIEPFFGSGAVLLARPDYDQSRHVETACDADGYVANVWRAIRADPDAVARWVDWPVNHADLSARKRRLLAEQDNMLANLIADDEWYDARLAGYWVWAASCWIGSGLTRLGAMPEVASSGKGAHAIGKRPHVSDGGKGVHAIGQRPDVSDGGMGVHALSQMPHVSDGGMGVHAIGQRPDVSDAGRNTKVYEWIRQLSQRLRYVRVVCGDWTRVCGGKWQSNLAPCGMFFDPPYGVTDRDAGCYHIDGTTVAIDVMHWVRERGDDPKYRIVVAGYEEHMPLVDDHGWRYLRWTAQGGYGNQCNGRGKVNRKREVLYFSPHCVAVEESRDLLTPQ